MKFDDLVEEKQISTGLPRFYDDTTFARATMNHCGIREISIESLWNKEN